MDPVDLGALPSLTMPQEATSYAEFGESSQDLPPAFAIQTLPFEQAREKASDTLSHTPSNTFRRDLITSRTIRW